MSGSCWVSLSLSVLGIFVSIKAVSLGIGRSSSPGAGYFPIIGSTLLTIFAVVVLLNDLRGKRERQFPPLSDMKLLIKVTCSLVLYVLVFTYLGYILSTFLLFLYLLYVGHYSYIATFVIALAVVLLSYLIFGFWLQVSFPRGPFPF